jgi:phosphatidylserine decarboxylase
MRMQTLAEARWIFGALVTLFVALVVLDFKKAAGIMLLLIVYTFYFFRDPERIIPPGEKAVVAAADGRISDIVEIDETEVLNQPMKRVAIFLSIFDVHVNRAPIAGKITCLLNRPGKFLDARHLDASMQNARRTWAIRGAGATVIVRQITGAIARRIVGWSSVGDILQKGERFGMIRFGSRTEVYLPIDSNILVNVGDKVRGGETVIAELPGDSGRNSEDNL